MNNNESPNKSEEKQQDEPELAPEEREAELRMAAFQAVNDEFLRGHPGHIIRTETYEDFLFGF